MVSGLSLLTRWRRLPAAMRVASVSAGALLVVIAAVLVRGAADWSGAFGVFWYGMFLLAVVSGVVGFLMAIGSGRLRRRERLLAIVLSLAAPATAGWFAYALSQFLDTVN